MKKKGYFLLKGRNILNLELLQVGTKVNYPILCQAFGKTPKTGNSKPKQLKEFFMENEIDLNSPTLEQVIKNILKYSFENEGVGV